MSTEDDYMEKWENFFHNPKMHPLDYHIFLKRKREQVLLLARNKGAKDCKGISSEIFPMWVGTKVSKFLMIIWDKT